MFKPWNESKIGLKTEKWELLNDTQFTKMVSTSLPAQSEQMSMSQGKQVYLAFKYTYELIFVIVVMIHVRKKVFSAILLELKTRNQEYVDKKCFVLNQSNW